MWGHPCLFPDRLTSSEESGLPAGSPPNQASVHAQSCLTLCDPMNCSVPGSSVHGVFPWDVFLYPWNELLFPPPGDLPRPGIDLLRLLCSMQILFPLNHQGNPGLSPISQHVVGHSSQRCRLRAAAGEGWRGFVFFFFKRERERERHDHLSAPQVDLPLRSSVRILQIFLP